MMRWIMFFLGVLVAIWAFFMTSLESSELCIDQELLKKSTPGICLTDPRIHRKI